MAMFPALMNDTMFSDLFDDPFFAGWRDAADEGRQLAAAQSGSLMNTDVRETDHGYEVAMDMDYATFYYLDRAEDVQLQKALAVVLEKLPDDGTGTTGDAAAPAVTPAP